MKKYISMMVTSLLAVSCVDTVIMTDDKTVDEARWKSNAHVQQNVNEAYRSMTTENVVSRLIVWGGLRSDELIPATSIPGTVAEDLTEINLANTQPDNTYATWADFYSVINKCNLVLNRASRALSEDPSYTDGDYRSDCSQMLALRALCYFYLVRNFRDVPYTTEAYMDATQVVDLPQSSPDYVLAQCISDLETAEK
ncbi:MAG: RagB/SusD family nutrient uptake outer membrane protein, partial [Prevotella sp.]|nr:RagB/SusD family nutrient uptake outer membrane protein [Prevotella sp.]